MGMSFPEAATSLFAIYSSGQGNKAEKLDTFFKKIKAYLAPLTSVLTSIRKKCFI